MSSLSSRAELQLQLQVARMYYEEDLTQNQIAHTIGFSRPTVSRLLDKARASGIVKISISHPIERLFQVEKKLIKKYGLAMARVAEVRHESALTATGKAAAQLFSENGGNGKVIAVSNGRAVAATVNSLPQVNWENSTVVQMIGTVVDGLLPEDSPAICRQVARTIGARYAQITAPLVLENKKTAYALKREEPVSTALALAEKADMALLGVGSVNNGVSWGILSAYIDKQMQEFIKKSGIAGHVTAHFFDSSGKHIQTPLCDRTVALEPEALKRIPLKIGVASGAAKVTAIRAAMIGDYINALVTDYETAQKLLA